MILVFFPRKSRRFGFILIRLRFGTSLVAGTVWINYGCWKACRTVTRSGRSILRSRGFARLSCCDSPRHSCCTLPQSGITCERIGLRVRDFGICQNGLSPQQPILFGSYSEKETALDDFSRKKYITPPAPKTTISIQNE